MIIVVNTRLLLKDKLEGIGWFTYEVLKRITRQYSNHRFIFLFDRPYCSEFIFSDNITPIIIRPPARHPLLWYIWFNYSVPFVVQKYNADIFFSPDGFLSLRTNIKQIPVIHDINFEHYPKDLPFTHRFYYKTFFKKYAQIAYKIGTVSNYSKQDIVETYNVNPQKISVIYNGVNPLFTPLDSLLQTEVRNKYTLGQPYFLFVGALHQRKNIARLIQAFNIFKQKTQSKFKLVLAGNKKWWTEEMETAYRQSEFKYDILFTGRVAQEELIRLVASAYALVYVPYFEGFGIPIIEAFKAGTAVITANVTSMPEIAKNAALLVNPFNVEDIAKAMILLYNQPKLRDDFINEGFKQAQKYSWEKTAAGVAELLDL